MPDQQQKPQPSMAAEEVLRTTELLEAILTNVDIKDLFTVGAVNTAFNDTVAGSIKLKRKMFLKPAAKPHTELLPNFIIPGLSLKLDRIPSHGGKQLGRIIIQYDMRAPRVHLGPRVRSMQICQHPIKWLRAYPLCCKGDWNGEDVVAHSAGISLGDIYDKALKLIAAHQACPNRIEEFKAAIRADPNGIRPLWAVMFTSQWFELLEGQSSKVQGESEKALAREFELLCGVDGPSLPERDVRER